MRTILAILTVATLGCAKKPAPVAPTSAPPPPTAEPAVGSPPTPAMDGASPAPPAPGAKRTGDPCEGGE